MEDMFIVETSARHIHLSDKDLATLFGEGHQLTNKKDLSQPGQFACVERVKVIGPKGELNMSVLGPTRKETQVEISLTDARSIWWKLPCHEGRFRRRRAGRSSGRHQEAGRRVQRDPHPPSSGRRYPHSHPLQKDFANSDCLPQKRRKNCEKSAEITEHRIENARPCRTNLLAGSFIFW